jgi:hypothetical protein
MVIINHIACSGQNEGCLEGTPTHSFANHPAECGTDLPAMCHARSLNCPNGTFADCGSWHVPLGSIVKGRMGLHDNSTNF